MSDFAADIAYSFSVSEMLDLIANPPSWYGVDEAGKLTTEFLIQEFDIDDGYEVYLNVKLAEPPKITELFPSGLIHMEFTYEGADPISHQEWRALNEEDK